MAALKLAPRGKGNPLGIHRVLDVEPRLPQPAERLDNSLPIYSNEILIEVERLNIDAASFVQMEAETGGDAEKIAEIILANCKARGKQHNRVTGSGGMLLGKVVQVGSDYKGEIPFKVGQRVATLVSLTMTPLSLKAIRKVHLKTHQVEVEGHAILFERTIAAVLPKGLPENVAMAVYDVAGAPATVDGLCKKNQSVVIVGAGGKAGVLCCVAAREKVGSKGKVIGIEPSIKAAKELRELKVCDEVLEINAKDPMVVQSAVEKSLNGKGAEVVVNVAPVPDTELATLLCAKPKGKILFFSMATSFTRVALGAEGIVSDATLLFGNGYYPNHAVFSIGLVMRSKKLKQLLLQRYSA